MAKRLAPRGARLLDRVAFDAALKASGLRVRQLAERVELAASTIYLIRSGWIPSLVIQAKIADALELKVEALWRAAVSL